MKLYTYICCSLVVLFCLSACSKDEEQNVLPAAAVDFRIDVQGVDNTLKTPGNFLVFKNPRRQAVEYVGFGGLLVVCSYVTNENTGDFILFAYDLACPYEKERQTVVVPNKVAGTATCAKCGRVYDIVSTLGSNVSNPSEHLQRYKVNASTEYGIFYVTR